jgi:hypothetical protein
LTLRRSLSLWAFEGRTYIVFIVSAKTKSDSHDKVLVVQRQPKSCGKEARRYDNSR